LAALHAHIDESSYSQKPVSCLDAFSATGLMLRSFCSIWSNLS